MNELLQISDEKIMKIFLIKQVSDIFIEYRGRGVSGDDFDILYDLTPEQILRVQDKLSEKFIKDYGKRLNRSDNYR